MCVSREKSQYIKSPSLRPGYNKAAGAPSFLKACLVWKLVFR